MAVWKEMDMFDHPNVSAFVKTFQRVCFCCCVEQQCLNFFGYEFIAVKSSGINKLLSDCHVEPEEMSSLGAFF